MNFSKVVDGVTVEFTIQVSGGMVNLTFQKPDSIAGTGGSVGKHSGDAISSGDDGNGCVYIATPTTGNWSTVQSSNDISIVRSC